MSMLCDRPVAVHIGYHKTATTFLQRQLFPDPEVFTTPWTIADLDELIVRPSPFSFEVAAVRLELERRAERGDRPLVISHEDLVGHPMSGGVAGPEIAARLVALFPGMRVLVVVREQTSMLVSIYKQYVRGGGALKLERLVQPLPNERRGASFNLDHYAYDRLVSYYQRRLGRERVTVLPFELLRRDSSRFLAEVCTATGAVTVPEVHEGVVNIGTSAFGTKLKRPLNHVFIRDALNPAPLWPVESLTRPIDAAVRRLDRVLPDPLANRFEKGLQRRAVDIVGDRFAESNTMLASLTGLNLAEYGYPVSSGPADGFQ